MITDKEMTDMVIYDRINWYAGSRENCMTEDEIEELNVAEKKFFSLLESFQNSDKQIISEFLDCLSGKYSRINEYYYRKGIEDGVKLDKLIQSWKDKQ